MIKVIISGKVTKDLEIKTARDKEYTNISICSRKKYKNADGISQYDFIDIVVFGPIAKQHAEHLQKGSYITAVCRLDTNKYVDKTGKEQRGFSFYAEDIEYVYTPKEDGEDEAIYEADPTPF